MSEAIEVTRDEHGNWWNKRGNRVYTGEDAKVLDLLLLPKETTNDARR